MCYKVDWYPWSEEAFAEARKRDVPIFLSSNYYSCAEQLPMFNVIHLIDDYSLQLCCLLHAKSGTAHAIGEVSYPSLGVD